MSKKTQKTPYVANAADYPNLLIQLYHVDKFLPKLNNLAVFHHFFQLFLLFIG